MPSFATTAAALNTNNVHNQDPHHGVSKKTNTIATQQKHRDGSLESDRGTSESLNVSIISTLVISTE